MGGKQGGSRERKEVGRGKEGGRERGRREVGKEKDRERNNPPDQTVPGVKEIVKSRATGRGSRKSEQPSLNKSNGGGGQTGEAG